MSATAKEVKSNLVALEPKTLTEILTIDDQLPDDFFTNLIYDKQLDKAIEASSNLVYPLDIDGEKQAKTDATNINKFATMVDKFVAATYKQQTEAVATWRDGKKLKIKLLRDNRQRLIDQFEEKRSERLVLIRGMLVDCIKELWGSDIKPEFQKGDIEPMVKFSSLTPGGKLTTGAVKFCKSIYDACYAEQQKIESRQLVLENRCLRADINPPLTQAHFGTVFYADDSLFNEKLEELIAAEVERKAEMEERIRKQQAAENQRKIDEALKAQQEEHDKAKRLEEFKKEQAALREKAQIDLDRPGPYAGHVDKPAKTTSQEVDTVIAELRKQQNDRRYPPVDPITHKPITQVQAPIAGKRTVTVTATFNADLLKSQLSEKLQAIMMDVTVTASFQFEGISERVSNQGVADFLKKQLPESLQALLVDASGENA